MHSGNIKVGIGFAAGRKNFQKVLKTHIYNLQESGLTENERVSLNLVVAYDLTYQKTRSTDFTSIPKDLAGQLDERIFIGYSSIREEINYLVNEHIITAPEASMIFGKGYAAKRNAIDRKSVV